MERSKPSFLLVDGNNVIHAWPDLRKLYRIGTGSAYAELTKRLLEYRDFTGQRIVVVFDGTGETRSEERIPGGLQVIHTSGGETADDVIERLAVSYAGLYDITVATDDLAEQDLVVAAGGEAISTAGLRERLELAGREMREWIRRHRKRE